MARRRLLGEEHWAGVFALPSEEREVVRHCTLTPDDLALVAAKRSAHNRLGLRAAAAARSATPAARWRSARCRPRPWWPTSPGQLGVDPATLAASPGRPQTRREQLGELMRRGGFRSFGRAEARALVAWLTSMAQTGRRPAELAGMLIEELRRQRILLPTPRVLELVVHHARARAERVMHRALLEGMAPEQAAELDRMLTPLSERGGSSRLAWLRQAPGSPAARNLRRPGRAPADGAAARARAGTARARCRRRRSTRSPARACA